MNKNEFIRELSERIRSLPQKEQEEILSYYSEMISERMEDGMTEQQAVEALGSVQEIAEGIMLDAPLTAIIKEKVKPKRELRGWEIALIIIGSPLWISLALVVFALVLVVYILLWTLVLVMWVVVLSFGASALACLLASVIGFAQSNAPVGLALLGAGMLLFGLCLYFTVLSVLSVKGAARLSVLIVKGIKKCFVKSSRKEK